jgi:hypothetical protein
VQIFQCSLQPLSRFLALFQVVFLLDTCLCSLRVDYACLSKLYCDLMCLAWSCFFPWPWLSPIVLPLSSRTCSARILDPIWQPLVRQWGRKYRGRTRTYEPVFRCSFWCWHSNHPLLFFF